MDEKTYVQLDGILRPLIEKETTQMREPISAHEKSPSDAQFFVSGKAIRSVHENKNSSAKKRLDKNRTG